MTRYIDKQKLTDFRVENGKDLVIPVAAKSGKITFQLDTLDVSEEEANANDLRLYAILGYTADGKQDYDVIDTIIDSFNTLTLTAPEEFSESFIEVSGIAPAGRIVSICIDGMERTRLQANKAGKYSGIFPMTASEMKDGQKLSLQAVITGSRQRASTRQRSFFMASVSVLHRICNMISQRRGNFKASPASPCIGANFVIYYRQRTMQSRR